MKEVDSLALANVQMHLEKAYKNFFSGIKDWLSKIQIKTQEPKKAIRQMWSMEIFR